MRTGSDRCVSHAQAVEAAIDAELREKQEARDTLERAAANVNQFNALASRVDSLGTQVPGQETARWKRAYWRRRITLNWVCVCVCVCVATDEPPGNPSAEHPGASGAADAAGGEHSASCRVGVVLERWNLRVPTRL